MYENMCLLLSPPEHLQGFNFIKQNKTKTQLLEAAAKKVKMVHPCGKWLWETLHHNCRVL